MKVAVLPLMPNQGTPAFLGRQFSNFASEQIRLATDAEVNSVSYLTQVNEEDGPRIGFINFADMKLEKPQIKELFEQSGVDVLVEGNIASTEDGFDMDVRFHHNGDEEPRRSENCSRVSAGEYRCDLPDAFRFTRPLRWSRWRTVRIVV